MRHRSQACCPIIILAACQTQHAAPTSGPLSIIILAACRMKWVEQTLVRFTSLKQGQCNCTSLLEQAVYGQLLQLQGIACAEQKLCSWAAAVDAPNPAAGLLGAGQRLCREIEAETATHGHNGHPACSTLKPPHTQAQGIAGRRGPLKLSSPP